MGRKKSEKGKEKKLKHKEEQKKVAEGQALSDAANQKADHLEELVPAFRTFTRNGLCIKLECKKASASSEEEKNVCFDLTKRNMHELYEKSSWGWKDKDKYAEITDDKAWYIIAKDAEGKIVGISHFRFDLDFDDPVLYCYEIQLEEQVRGKGLGKFMLQILELMGFRAKMSKVMVTVFKDNKEAVNFFNNLKYVVDETSPRYYDPMHPDDYDYEILSKSLIRKTAQQ
ncbi:N-alpha-acetyltransferase 40-like [Rhopilema esculentum]|uniref:N-alpha-acetyltransferase 40-like n=1 Tax=Rhopilema esculentum TaxID=499914 RepID=UPI0031E3372B